MGLETEIETKTEIRQRSVQKWKKGGTEIVNNFQTADLSRWEKITGISRKIIHILEKYDSTNKSCKNGETTGLANEIMEYIKGETKINDEKIILRNIYNILHYKNGINEEELLNNDKKDFGSISNNGEVHSVKDNIKNLCFIITNGYDKAYEQVSKEIKNLKNKHPEKVEISNRYIDKNGKLFEKEPR